MQRFRDERDAALESYSEAQRLFRAVGAKLGEANVLGSQLRLKMLNDGNIANGEHSLLQLIEIRQSIRDVFSEGADYFNFSVTLTVMHEWGKAIQYCLQARKVLERVGEENPVEQTLRLETGIRQLREIVNYLNQDDKQSAKKLLLQARALLIPTGEPPLFSMLDDLEKACQK